MHIAHEEGRALKLGDYFRYEFNLTDHLGNVRVSFSDTDYDGALEAAEGKVLQIDQYYPFGMRMGGLSYQAGTENRYRYNGKEYHQELGLGLYDYGFRWYDPAIGRFTGVDPIAEDFNWVTPYNYVENEPVAHIDLWGLQKAGMQMGIQNTREYIKKNKSASDLAEFDASVDKMYSRAREVANFFLDEVPVVGEIKSLAQGDFTGTLLGIIPFGKRLRNLFKKGDDLTGELAEKATDLKKVKNEITEKQILLDEASDRLGTLKREVKNLKSEDLTSELKQRIKTTESQVEKHTESLKTSIKRKGQLERSIEAISERIPKETVEMIRRFINDTSN